MLYIHCTSGQTSRQSSCSPLHQQILYLMPYLRTLVPSCFPEKCGKHSCLFLLLQKKHLHPAFANPNGVGCAFLHPFYLLWAVAGTTEGWCPWCWCRVLSSATVRAGGRQSDHGPLQPHQLANHSNVFPEHSGAKSRGMRGEGIVLVEDVWGGRQSSPLPLEIHAPSAKLMPSNSLPSSFPTYLTPKNPAWQNSSL